MKRKSNIAAVARRAGVGVSTISRYLNGHYVSTAARARIANAIDALDYKPSPTARNLSLGRRGCIGVVVDSIQDPWFTQVLVGIEEELSPRDESLMLASTELTGKYEPGVVLEWIRERRVDGLILAKSQRRDRPIIREAVEAQLPTVLVGPDEGFSHVQIVRCDNRSAGISVANHLFELGHKHVAFAGGPAHSIDSKHRLLGLRDGLRSHGINLAQSNVFSCDSYEADAGFKFGRTFFEKPRAVTAIVLANDALASGFMRVAHEIGVRMPQQLSVVGFDGLPEGERLWPALTSAAQPMRQMGRAACRRLFEVVGSPGQVQTIEFRMELLVRDSTGPGPRSLGLGRDMRVQRKRIAS